MNSTVRQGKIYHNCVLTCESFREFMRGFPGFWEISVNR
jgi:hypothetical protein